MNKNTMGPDPRGLKSKIKSLLLIFIMGLLLSGITAFPIETELRLAHAWIGSGQGSNRFVEWVNLAYNGVVQTNAQFPFIAYGTDWLAFAHLILAVAFVGPLREPVRNIWVVQFGLIACASVLPLAFIAGHIRGIPVFWRLFDCAFGIMGALVLIPCYKNIRRLEALKKAA